VEDQLVTTYVEMPQDHVQIWHAALRLVVQLALVQAEEDRPGVIHSPSVLMGGSVARLVDKSVVERISSFPFSHAQARTPGCAWETRRGGEDPSHKSIRRRKSCPGRRSQACERPKIEAIRVA